MNHQHQIDSGIRERVRAVAARIRRLLGVELAAQAVALLVAVVALLFVADYLLELPTKARAVALALAAVFAVGLLGWSRGLALLRPLRDLDVAQWIAKQRPELADALITAIEPSPSSEPQNLEETRLWADQLTRGWDPLQLVSAARPRKWVVAAAACVAMWVAAVWCAPQTAAHFSRRLALSEAPWPRRVALTAEGFSAAADGVATRFAPRGAPLELVLNAAFQSEADRPQGVQLTWRAGPGPRGRSLMVERGAAPTQRAYIHRLDSLARDTTFWAYGGDGRIGPLRVLARPRPLLTALRVRRQYPAYLGRPDDETPAASFDGAPEGALLTLFGRSSKPLRAVETGDETLRPAIHGNEFELQLPPLHQQVSLQLILRDAEGIASEPPFAFAVTPTPDAPPSVTIRFDAEAPVATPNARLPLRIEARDDTALTTVRYRAEVDGGESVERPLPQGETFRPGATLARADVDLDLLEEAETGASRLGPVEPGDRIKLIAEAADGYDLLGERHVERSRTVEIEIISPNDFLARIVEREANLRRVFEQVYAGARRESLRLDERSAAPDSAGLALEAEAWRRVSEETAAAAQVAGAIVAELQANRIEDTPLIDRLRRRVAEPLSQLARASLPGVVASIQAGDPKQVVQQRVAEGLQSMRLVLDSLRSIDEYQAVVQALRVMVDRQRALQDRTQTAGRASARALLLEGLGPEGSP